MFQDANRLAMRLLETSVERYECAGGRAIEMKRMCIGVVAVDGSKVASLSRRVRKLLK
jgi:hypothetical protein